MIETATLRQTAVATVVRVLVVFESVAFVLAALLHLGERIPVGSRSRRARPALARDERGVQPAGQARRPQYLGHGSAVDG
jgi:hypothetical protein